MLHKIGFFHFGSGHDKPKEVLESALADVQSDERRLPGTLDPTNSLIVLPEAFNIGRAYRAEGAANFNRSILEGLQCLAARFQVGFVAGLIIHDEGGPSPPYSAAYLIDGSGCEVMGYKVGADDMAGKNYTPFRGAPDTKNPILYKGIPVGALICVDGHFPISMSQQLGKRRATVVTPSRVICLPVHMAKDNLYNGTSGTNVALIPDWKSKTLIVANSRADGIDSFITDGSGTILTPTAGGPNHRIVCLPLA